MFRIPLAIISADKEIIELIKESSSFKLVGIFDANPEVDTHAIAYLGQDSEWPKVKDKYPGLQVALSVDSTRLKEDLANFYGLDSLATIISSGAFVSLTAQIGKGCLIQQGVKVMASAKIGLGCKINVNAVVHHDSVVGTFCTLAPGSLILGRAVLEDRVFIGAGAVILPKVRIGHDAVIGAGAVVTRDVEPGKIMVGVPAKELVKNN